MFLPLCTKSYSVKRFEVKPTRLMYIISSILCHLNSELLYFTNFHAFIAIVVSKLKTYIKETISTFYSPAWKILSFSNSLLHVKPIRVYLISYSSYRFHRRTVIASSICLAIMNILLHILGPHMCPDESEVLCVKLNHGDMNSQIFSELVVKYLGGILNG